MKFAKNLYDGRTAVHPAPLVPPLLFIFYSIIIISIAFLILLFLNYQFGVLYQKSCKPAVPVHIVSIEYTSPIAAKTSSPDYITCRLWDAPIFQKKIFMSNLSSVLFELSFDVHIVCV